ncbi:Vitamin D3 receptor [Amphibalanus amphitrite]|uniref:Vitamin D3 receptor n=1 Tax=Amphibalanus amphitrite TaxID=1232801 RepID=A0A6A4VV30_AMPAM|nr:Vitamin D3 receptor [Amphibalanus amphitrite]
MVVDQQAASVQYSQAVKHGGVVKICGVCSDRAKSLHFGGMACDSCKAFFRRSVQNEAYKHFRCSYEGRCSITITSRKCCQYCRVRYIGRRMAEPRHECL